MIFRINRTSDYLHKEPPKPCKNAVKVTEGIRPWRFSNELQEVVHYEIEINTLEELINLYKEVGEELIITDETIEIYDGYRE